MFLTLVPKHIDILESRGRGRDMGKVRRLLTIFVFLMLFLGAISIANAGELTKAALVVSKGDPNQSKVALTFDVEGGTDIEKVLTILDNYQVKATFFLLGTWVEQHPQLARKIVTKGHEIGNHTYSHPQLTRLTKEEMIKDIHKGEAIIAKATGINPSPNFRAPYGAINATVLQAISEAGYNYNYNWSVDPRDWDGKSAKSITNIVLGNLHPGAIILLHLNNTNTPEALPTILDGLKHQGYQAVQLSQMGNNNPIAIAKETVAKDSANEGKRSFVRENEYLEVSLAVNGNLINMSNTPRLVADRTFVPARDLAEILGGIIEWNGVEKQVTLRVQEKTFQFDIAGETRVNDKLIGEVPSAFILNDRTMVPLYIFNELFGFSTVWDGVSKTVHLMVV